VFPTTARADKNPAHLVAVTDNVYHDRTGPVAMGVFYKWGGGVGADLPRVRRAYDEFLVTDDGELIDAAAGAAVANLGHSVQGVGDVAARQADEVGYLSTTHFAHDATDRLADRLTDHTPDGVDHPFLVNSGSEAIESAFKLARAYHRERGAPDKHKVVGRWASYHGATLGALSASGNTGRRSPFDPLVHDWPKAPPAYPYRWPYDGSPAEQARAAARDLERVVRREGPETVAAFVAEPVSGASIPAAHPHPAYFEEVRRICDEYDLLFVADEVMTGFGRVGPAFGVERFDVTPDVLAVGKGLSGGYVPVSAAVVHDRVAEVFAADGGAEFDHGHTHSGAPVGAAVAAHVVDRYDESVFAAGRALGERIEGGLAPLRDHPHVGEVRRAGAMLGVEFVRDRSTKEPFDPDRDVADAVYEAAMDRGVYTYPGGGSVDGAAGDHLMLAPPLTTSDGSADAIASAVVGAVEDALGD
jgi:adenosylmethionine-8-amino-7-oxononanoate aminotransferase